MIIEKIDEKIIYYKDLLDDPSDFVLKIEDLDSLCSDRSYISDWKDWSSSTYTNGNENEGKRKYGYTKDINLFPKWPLSEGDFGMYKIYSTLQAISKFAFTHYAFENKVNPHLLPTSFSIKKYNENVFMGPHVDSEDPTDIKHPVVSGVFYLNSNYSGGEILFPNQNLLIKPEAGSLVIFPSIQPYIHVPQSVTKGTKYMVTIFWYETQLPVGAQPA